MLALASKLCSRLAMVHLDRQEHRTPNTEHALSPVNWQIIKLPKLSLLKVKLRLALGTEGAWSAVQRVAGFVVSMHLSPERQQSFPELMRKEYYDKPAKAKAALPTKPNDTRWNSQLATLRSAFHVCEAIEAAFAYKKDPSHVCKAFGMTEDDWCRFEHLIDFLALSERVSVSVQASGSTLEDVLEYHVLMCTQLDSALRERRDHAGARLDAQDEKARTAKAADAPPPDGRCAELVGKGRTGEQPEAIPLPAVGDSPLKAARLQRAVRVESQSSAVESPDPVEEKVSRYIGNEAAWRNTDGKAENWWKDNEVEFPNLAKLARIYLAIPGSTASVERVFPTAGWICSARRGRLNGESLGLLVSSTKWMSQGVDRLVGLDDTSRQAEAPILQVMDNTIAAEKVKRRAAEIKGRAKMRAQAADA
ncbi:hypothetical protein A4X13_0g8248 [Tilletia indica]|uniref:HAT C-terminal dimerisation domain-containing protein n=1 Tax=Tilletia indica TaxID=43049 RepID=A0A177T2U5_9BASI|nr:hypothetical protein A4X13_0g8248 [Tilletia indica]